MKLASLAAERRDGRLVVVSSDGARILSAPEPYSTLQLALESWSDAEPALRRLATQLDRGEGESAAAVRFAAPLPRAWQWLDGSAFKSHGDLMQKLFGVVDASNGLPLMYQGLSHRFLSATEDVGMRSEEDGIDFEGEFGVIVDDVPMGVSPERALSHVKLIVQVNDWSLRGLAAAEMKTGFGWVQAKPACSCAPFAITPDELGDYWEDGRVHLNLVVDLNGQRFGAPHGGVMEFGFHELIAHAAATRDLCAGTIIGSGTVSNSNFRDVGSTCIAERRALEMVDTGAVTTPFMRFGDTVSMEARRPDLDQVLFGAIKQRVIAATVSA